MGTISSLAEPQGPQKVIKTLGKYPGEPTIAHERDRIAWPGTVRCKRRLHSGRKCNTLQRPKADGKANRLRYGIYSDIHGNLEALQAVLKSMEDQKVERRICLGDAVGYGPYPNECVQLIRERSALALLGNHDSVALGRESAENFNLYARKAIEWTQENLAPEAREFLDGLPYTATESPLHFVHASPRSPADWFYITNFDDAVDAFSFWSERICFLGHTHIPSMVVMENSQSYWVAETSSYDWDAGQRLLINVGSVGQPRDHIPRAAWCLCDTVAQHVEIVRVEYDVAKTQERMRALGFAEFLINRLAEGR